MAETSPARKTSSDAMTAPFSRTSEMLDAGRGFMVHGARQLDLESKAPDPRAAIRAEIREGVRALRPVAGDWLYATYHTPGLLPQSDVENVLFTNADATGGLFGAVTRCGLVFELVPRSRPEAPGPMSHEYRLAPEGRAPAAWSRGKRLAFGERIAVPSFPNATRSGSVWWDLVHGSIVMTARDSAPRTFCVDLVVEAPTGTQPVLAKHIKVAVDATVLALSHENGRSPAKGVEIFARSIGQPVERVLALLKDDQYSVFGDHRLVNARGQAQPPDSGCVLGSLSCIASPDASWRLSFSVHEVVSRE